VEVSHRLSLVEALATASAGELAVGLGPLAAGYEAWLDEQQTRVAGLPEALRETAETAIFTALQCVGRIRAGIELLTSPSAPGHEVALEAFANQATALQRRHTTIAAIRESRGLSYAEAVTAVEARVAEVASWRLFQLAFVLLNLPALTDPAHPDRVPAGHCARTMTAGGSCCTARPAKARIRARSPR
jgi:hypothetical protein